MCRILKPALIGLGLLGLAGCGAPQEPLGPEAFYSPSPDGQTRLVIFRDDYSGLLIQPKVFVDGQQAGNCSPGKVTTVKVTPGTHEVSGATLQEKSITVTVPKGNTVYVSCAIGLGVLVGPVEFAVRVASEAASKVAKMQARTAE
jgi:hypothetical protein